MSDELLHEVRRLWRGVDSGVLSTTSLAVPGYPFGSVVPYVTTPEGHPVIYVSTLAQHTKNLSADPRCCLTVVEGGDDAQAGSRISLLGDAAQVDDARRAAIASRYYACFPDSARFADMHDFAFWAIAPRRLRYIAGFGKIHWIEPEAWLHPAPEWLDGEAGIVAHMNDDHPDALRSIARSLCGADGEARMLALDPGGLHLRASNRVHYVPFAAPCSTSAEVRAEAVRLTQAARAADSA